MAAAFIAVTMLAESQEATVTAQLRPWKTWVKSSPCSVTRLDWVSAAQTNPTQGGGGSFWYQANLIVTGATCARDVENCTFAAAQAALPGIRADERFLNFCCHDYTVYENDQTKERTYLKSLDGKPGNGPWSLVKGFLCCEEAMFLAGKSGGCGTGSYNKGKYSVGTDMPGGDYQSVELERADPELCMQACLADVGKCRGFTYVKPGVQGPKAKCWLKSSTGPTIPAACCTSAKVDESGVVSPVDRGNKGGFEDTVIRVGDKKVTIGEMIPPKNPPKIPQPTPEQPVGHKLPQGVVPCDADERAAFAQMTGSFHNGNSKVTIGGSCENVQGTTLTTEYCENPDATYNKSLPRYTTTFTGRMSGSSISVQFKSSDTRRPTGTGSCSKSTRDGKTLVSCSFACG
jgi:PAN domain